MTHESCKISQQPFPRFSSLVFVKYSDFSGAILRLNKMEHTYDETHTYADTFRKEGRRICLEGESPTRAEPIWSEPALA
jgi:hypothetical protein